MADLGTPLHLTEVDGVPCFWADAPGPCSAGLLFRVGRADEQLASGGITRLAARGGQVDAATTAFYFTGEHDEVAAALTATCGALHAPPGDGFEAERRELAIDAERDRPGTPARLLMMRFGAQGFGLGFYEQFGLRRLAREHVAAWARERFTSGNAALWMSRRPPDGLRLPLPPGPRLPPPATEPMAGLELPAFAAVGSDGVASALVAERSTAMTVASRVAAARARALGHGVEAWQFPLTGRLAHRYLAIDCSDDEAPGVLEDLLALFDSLAADGPSADELNSVRATLVGALADPESVPGALDAMAVDELLGAPRMWKEDVAAAAEAVSYAEAAAAIRAALATQLVLAPATTPKPENRPLADFPWFSRARVQGMELRPDRRQKDRDARLVVSQEGVSHVAGERASTVRFADVAAALQEEDGSLTLIGRDGAIVPIDPGFFKGAGQIAADLERRLAPELLVPPRDATGGGLERLARRKLRPRWNIDRNLKLLRSTLDHDEQPVTMSEAVVGIKHGLLCVTDRRIVWVFEGDRDSLVRELPYATVLSVAATRFPSQIVTVRAADGDIAFSQVNPKERAGEIVDEVNRRMLAARAGARRQP